MPRKASSLPADRRSFLKTALIGAATATVTPLYPALGAAREIVSSASGSGVKPFELDEITVADLQDGMKSGKFTARSLVAKYSARIEEIDTNKDKNGPSINSIIELNPGDLSIAESLDQERKVKKTRG